MSRSTPFQDWFDNLDWDAIEQLRQERAEESIHREFKRFTDPKQFSSADRKQLAKAIAGFSNAEGGVFVFGPITRDEDGIDGVSEIQLIENLSQVSKKIRSLLPDAASPAVNGVEFKPVQSPRASDSGVVAVLIPESDTTPHMAKLGVNQYTRRCSDTTRLMEHNEIADMFGKRPSPVLRLHMTDNTLIETLEKRENEYSNQKYLIYKFSLTIGIKNCGCGTATFPSLELWMIQDSILSIKHHYLQGHEFGLPRRRRGRSPHKYSHIAFGGNMQEAVLPGETLYVVQIDVEYAFKPYKHESQMKHIAKLGYIIRADGVLPTAGIVSVDSKMITSIAPGTLSQSADNTRQSSDFDFDKYFTSLCT